MRLTGSPVIAFAVLACTASVVVETSEETRVEESSQIDPSLAPLVAMAKQDLAERLAVEVEEIEVREARLVVWPDTAMGCPQPGMQYLQVPQDGSLIRLEAAGELYAYHSGGNRSPFLCE